VLPDGPEEDPPPARKRRKGRHRGGENPLRLRPARRRSEAEIDLRVVGSQLRYLQFVLAGLAGLLLGGAWQGAHGAMAGLAVGCVLVILRINALCALVGAAAGAFGAHLSNPSMPDPYFVFGLFGLLLGMGLGDWRRLWGPPGSGLPRTPDAAPEEPPAPPAPAQQIPVASGAPRDSITRARQGG
jgi:hypothetical protein